MDQNERHKSYEFTQKLAFFVIGLEAIFCGYLLLNADKLSRVECAHFLYLASGLAAFFGILWRFFYNETYHETSHNNPTKHFKLFMNFQIISYYFFIGLSLIFLLGILVGGCKYLNSLQKKEVSSEAVSKDSKPENTSVPSQK